VNKPLINVDLSLLAKLLHLQNAMLSRTSKSARKYSRLTGVYHFDRETIISNKLSAIQLRLLQKPHIGIARKSAIYVAFSATLP